MVRLDSQDTEVIVKNLGWMRENPPRHMPEPKVQARKARLRPLAPLKRSDVGIVRSGVALPMSSALEDPLIEVPLIGQLQTVTNLYMRRDGDSLLISRAQMAPREQCKHTVKLANVRSVERISKDTFQLLLSNAPPLRFCANSVFTCNEWMIMLERLVGSTKDQAPSLTPVVPSRSISLASLSPRQAATSPRASGPAPIRIPSKLLSSPIDVTQAHPRGWAVNIRAGQRGLNQLKSITMPQQGRHVPRMRHPLPTLSR